MEEEEEFVQYLNFLKTPRIRVRDWNRAIYMGVSLNGGTPKSSFSIGISIINHPFWGTPIFANTHMDPQNDPSY